MNLLPLVTRELRTALRRPNTYRLRKLAGAGAICISCWALLVGSGWTGGMPVGRFLLSLLATAAYVGALLTGVVSTADSLSQEKREATLGFLFLANLRTRDIVLGKFAAKVILPFYGLLALMPAFSICLLVGGVSGLEFGRMFLALGNALFLSLAAALLASALCEQQRLAYLIALLFVLLLAAGPPLLGYALFSSSRGIEWYLLASLFTPTGTYWLAYDQYYQQAAGCFWSSLLMNHFFGWLGLRQAARILQPAAAEERPAQGGAALRTKLWKAPMASRSPAEVRPPLTANPIVWLINRRLHKPLLAWGPPAAVAGLCLAFDPAPFGNAASQISFVICFALHGLLKIWLAVDASHVFALDRRTGALELLLGTPLPAREIARSVVSGLFRRCAGPLLVLAFLDLALAVGLWGSGRAEDALLIGTGAILLLLDAYCVCWVGLWRGLVPRQAVLATLATLWRVLFLPWLVFGAMGAVFFKSTPVELTGLWFIIGVINNGVFLRNAKRNLTEHFRGMALRPHGEKPPHLESEWSAMNWELEPNRLVAE